MDGLFGTVMALWKPLVYAQHTHAALAGSDQANKPRMSLLHADARPAVRERTVGLMTISDDVEHAVSSSRRAAAC
jgi:hypothetical protein